MRWLRRLFALIGLAIVIAVGAAGLAGFLAAGGRSAGVLKPIAARAARLFVGQHTEHVALDVAVRPEEGRISGSARLRVRSVEEGRRRFYFLLNDALRMQAVRVYEHPAARVYRFWLLVVLDLGAPIKAGEAFDAILEYEGAPSKGLFSLASGTLTARDVRLNADEFWFPADLQGQFSADVTVTLPAHLTLAHAGDEQERWTRGSLQRVRWTYPRPVPGLSLVAGPYRLAETYAGSVKYRVFLADDVDLDAARIFASMADAERILRERYGPAGYPTLALYVTRGLRRGYNDGAGLIGLSIRYFRRGDYGFGILAHEIAHNWWGATVMEKWLEPGTGGEWLVEGFAEFSSLIATEERFGPEALARRLALESFDPRNRRAVSDMSVIDNALGADSARETIYHKGAYVALMLRRLIGDDRLFSGLRAVIERFRHRSASERDVEEALASAGADVGPFFSEWVRSGKALDLGFEPVDGTQTVTLRNAGDNSVVGDVDVWLFGPGDGEPERRVMKVGATIDVPRGAELVADPRLAWADMLRENNRFAPAARPLFVAPSPDGTRVEVWGEPGPWSPARLRFVKEDGSVAGEWNLEAGVLDPPRWVNEHSVLLSVGDKPEVPPAVVIADLRDGSRRTIGRGYGPVVTADTVYAARDDRVLRWSGPRWREEAAWRARGWKIEALSPSPDGLRLAYAAMRRNEMELRVLSLGDRVERSLLIWDRDLVGLVWASDGSRLYAAVGGNWDWQVWEVPINGGGVRPIVREAAALGAPAISAGANLLAVPAAVAPDYPVKRQAVFVLDLAGRGVRRFELEDADVRQVAWSDDDTLLAVIAPASEGARWFAPEDRQLARIRVSAGQVERLGPR